MDLAITGHDGYARIDCVNLLKHLEFIFSRTPCITSVKLIETATVPVLKLSMDPSLPLESLPVSQFSSELKADIIVAQCEPYGLPNSAFRTTSFILNCVNMYPSFKTIMVFLKYILSQCGLLNAYKGVLIRRAEFIRLEHNLHVLSGCEGAL